jgi:DNA topoisomerase-1
VRALALVALALLPSLAFAYEPQTPQASAAKFKRAAKLATIRKAFMREQHDQLMHPALDKKTAVAAIATIMDKTNMRVGSAKYAAREEQDVKMESGEVIHQEPSFGASSLLKSQVTVNGADVHFKFRGKAHVSWDRTVHDPALAKTVTLFKSQRGPRLFKVGEGEDAKPVTELAVRPLFKSVGAKVKDLRTVQANELLAKALATRPKPTTKAQAEAQLTDAIKEVAHGMGHTPAICRSSYLNPKTLQAYTSGLP